MKKKRFALENQTCPQCKIDSPSTAELCPNCFFPFNGTDKEKAIFIATSIRNKGKVKGAKEALKTAQIALWILTGLHILGLLIIKDPTALVFQFSFTAMFLVAALALKLRPITVLTIVVTILGLFYLFLLVFDRNAFLSGLLWKMLTMITLGYSLYAVITAKKTQEISPYLLQEGEDNLKPKIKPDEDLLDI